MITQTFINITFVKVNQRFSDTAAGAGKTRQQFKRTERLVRLQMMIAVVQQ